jgi:hypothetical protein
MGRRTATIMAAAVLSGLAAVAALAAGGAPGGTPVAAAFRLEDGSAGCNYRTSGELVCRAVGDQVTTVLTPSGEARRDPGEVVALDGSTPVLLASESWWNGDASCRVAGPRIVCASGGGTIAVGGDR